MKLSVVGASAVGVTTAQRLAERDDADVVLLDDDVTAARAAAEDINDAAAAAGYEPRASADGWHNLSGSDITVITAAGSPAADESRLNSVCVELRDRAPDAVVIVAIEPVSATCDLVLEATCFPRSRVLGVAGGLEGGRLRSLVAAEAGVSIRDVGALVLGGGGRPIVPVAHASGVAGQPLADLLPPARLARVSELARARGLTPLTTSAAVAEVVAAIACDSRRVLVCAARCAGEYGIDGRFTGVPVRLGADGIEEIVEVPLAADERARLLEAAA